MQKPKRGVALKTTNWTAVIGLLVLLLFVSVFAAYQGLGHLTSQQIGQGLPLTYTCPQDNVEAQQVYQTQSSTLWVTVPSTTGSTSYAVRMLEAYESWQITIPEGNTAIYSVTQADGWAIPDITLQGPSILGFSSSIHNHDGNHMDFTVVIDELGTVPNSPQSQSVTMSRINGWHPVIYTVTITCVQ